MEKNQSTHKQIADRYIAKLEVFKALTQGRHISFLDSAEFNVSEMHTTICMIRKDLTKKNLPYEMRDTWMTFGNQGKRCKVYWFEEKEDLSC